MNTDEARLILEDLEVDPDKIDEFLRFLSLSEEEQKRIAEENGLTEMEIKLMDPTLDWRKKAQIAAKIVSRNIENY